MFGGETKMDFPPTNSGNPPQVVFGSFPNLQTGCGLTGSYLVYKQYSILIAYSETWGYFLVCLSKFPHYLQNHPSVHMSK